MHNELQFKATHTDFKNIISLFTENGQMTKSVIESRTRTYYDSKDSMLQKNNSVLYIEKNDKEAHLIFEEINMNDRKYSMTCYSNKVPLNARPQKNVITVFNPALSEKIDGISPIFSLEITTEKSFLIVNDADTYCNRALFEISYNAAQFVPAGNKMDAGDKSIPGRISLKLLYGSSGQKGSADTMRETADLLTSVFPIREIKDESLSKSALARLNKTEKLSYA